MQDGECGDDGVVWSAVLAGDGDAFGVLFDRHHDRVFRHVVGLLDSGSDADDVAAATFLEFWRRRDAVRVVEGSVLPWLLVTAGYIARNHGRRVRRYRGVLHELPREHRSVDAAEVAEQRIEAGERSARLAAGIARLRPVDAQLIALTALGGCSVTEAAEALGFTPGAARVRLHRARTKLRDLLDAPHVASAKESAR